MTENMNSQKIFIRKKGENKVFMAQKVVETRPDFIREEKAFRLRNTWYLKDQNDELNSSGEIGEAYWITSGMDDTKIIEIGAYHKYIVCNEDGTEDFGLLSEFQAA